MAGSRGTLWRAPTSWSTIWLTFGYLERHGVTGPALDRLAALHTDVTQAGSVTERARVANSSSATTCRPSRTRSVLPAAHGVPHRVFRHCYRRP
ncbi:MAG: hypothetical protein ACLQFR_09260 [Streptosporangiaceae bacterium]